jgi:ABC-type dipeptide/oligopeptide/nickel transport system ATPase component
VTELNLKLLNYSRKISNYYFVGPNSSNHNNTNNNHHHNLLNDSSQTSQASLSNDFKSKKFNIKKEEVKEPKQEFIDQKSNDITNIFQPSTSSLTNPVLTIEEEIAKIRSQLPPIDYEAAARDMFDEYNIINEYGDQVECTCTFREVISYLGEEDDVNNIKPNLPPSIKDEVLKNGNDDKDADESDDEETDDFCAVDEVDDALKSPPSPPRGAVKSIFDPEYDANENLIEEMVRRKPNSARVIEVKVQKEAVKTSRIEPIIDAVPMENLERVPVINYVCDEDPMCPARAHFQREPVQLKEVKKLHRFPIACVNGNWNGIPIEKTLHDYSKDNEQIDYEKNQLWKQVVPKYGWNPKYDFFTCDRIPKTFDDGSPFSIPPPPIIVKEENNDDEPNPYNGLNSKKNEEIEFREWHECVNVRSFDDEVLTILPYVIID